MYFDFSVKTIKLKSAYNETTSRGRSEKNPLLQTCQEIGQMRYNYNLTIYIHNFIIFIKIPTGSTEKLNFTPTL